MQIPASAERADVALVRTGLFDSRAKAREAIEAGLVTLDGAQVLRPATPVPAGATLAATPPYPWVSRGGVKLAAALEAFAINPHGLSCLDIGASTGGFSHVLLSRGASHVTAVDVGHGQLHASLAGEPRLHHIEGRDARTLRPDDLPGPPALVTVDVSFISLRLVLPTILPLAAAGAACVALIKPQFEAGPSRVRKGVVRDGAVHREVCDTIVEALQALGWRVFGLIPSPIAGGDGNREFLVGARCGP